MQERERAGRPQRYCKGCGALLRFDDSFCVSCGKPSDAMAQSLGRESTGPEPRGDEGKYCRGSAQDATTSAPIAAQQGVVKRLESLREEVTLLRDQVDRALSSGAFTYTADPTSAFMELMSVQKDSAALLAYLDQMASFIPSLTVPQAFEEELWFQAEVLRVVKKIKELDPAGWRERTAPRPQLPRRPPQPPRYVPPHPPPFGLSRAG
jgi:hypothetical protein